MYRTHTCNELRERDVGKKATLAGWVATIRDHGGLKFLDLRDQYGETQIVFHDDALLEGITRETVISAAGTVRLRDDDTINPKLDTGRVELRVESIRILGPCRHVLPFEIAESTKTREEIRLKHRYLDLRNPAIHRNILLRSQVLQFLRAKMTELGFAEIQTPILTASSPEGARDYLVPSRKHRGEFYALPQAPQQFKQMLMVAGFDRYFQIAPCFRDEDARGDRSPGEFYQLDFEMAFAEQEDVLRVAEQVVGDTFRKFSDKKVPAAPFRRVSYREAMLRYGTDKPDLRNPLLIQDLTGFFGAVKFPAFRGKPVRGIVADCRGRSRSFFEGSEKYALSIGMKGLGYITRQGDALKGPIEKFLSPEQKRQIVADTGLPDGQTLFFISSGPEEVDLFAGQIRTWLGQALELIEPDAFELCFVVDFPMYELDPQTGKLGFTHNPFSMPQGGLAALETKDPLEVLAYQYDLVCNGVELASGAVRNHSPEVMKKAFAIAGYTEEELARRFGALYTAFQYGAPPHAGMAPGVDRMLMLLTGEETIRDVIAFPLNGAAQDLMMGAPCAVSEQQLREVHIRLR